jgi:tetrahydrodipicolinate N-succinyltransferase
MTTDVATLAATIEAAWDARDTVTPASADVRVAVEAAFALLESGEARVAEKIDGEWVVNQWLKKAVLLSFRLNDNGLLENGMGGAPPGTRWRSRPRAGARTISAPPVSAPCRAPWRAWAATSPRAWC